MANIPSSDPRNNCATHFGSRSLFVSKVANVQSTPCPNPRVLFYPSGERTLGTRLVLPLALAWFYWSPMQTDATLLANNSQHCWISHVASVCTPTLFYVVGSCCTKFETGQTFIDVQTDATTPNMLDQQCWEFVRPFARSLAWTSTVEREQNLGGIWQYESFRFFFFSSLLSQSFGWMSCAHFVAQNNLPSTFFGLFAQASEARKDSGKLEFVYRKRGRRSADQKARRLWVRGT